MYGILGAAIFGWDATIWKSGIWIATNIPQRLNTGFVVQGHTCLGHDVEIFA